MSAIMQTGLLALRPMLEEDLAEIICIEEKAYAYPWTIGIFRDCLRVGYHCQILEQNGEIQGYAVMSEAVGEAHILNVCVRPQSQGNGFGRLLVNDLLDAARRLSADIMLLEVRPSNKTAINLYHEIGFCEVGTRKNYYPGHNGREDALILALNL